MKFASLPRTLVGWLVVALFAFAFGLLAPDATATPSSSLWQRLEVWFFETRGAPNGMVLLLAGWMALRRFEALRRAEGSAAGSAVATSIALAALGSLIFAWAHKAAAPDLFFVSGSAFLGAFAASRHGIPGLKRLGWPMLVLLFALPIPSPAANELLWTLQNFSAAGAQALLDLAGFEVERHGAHLTRGELNFLVIEGCSGQRSILTLTLVAIVVRELGATRGAKSWIPLLAAPPLALILNLLRIVAIVLSASPDDPDLARDHLGQGLVVLAVGTIGIFVLAHALEAPEDRDAERRNAAGLPSVGALLRAGALATRGPLVLGLLLAGLRLSVEPYPPPLYQNPAIPLPESAGAWQSEVGELDYPFLGILPRGEVTRRIYQRRPPLERLGPRLVDVLIARADEAQPRRSPLGSKLRVPGRAWDGGDAKERIHYGLGRDIVESVAQSRNARALVYSWTSHDEGLVRDSLRSWLALERGPFARPRARTIIRLATELGSEEEGLENARRILERFVTDFRDSLRAQ